MEQTQTMSGTIGKLAGALSAAQSMMQGAKADSENPYFKSKYADLASVWDACREPLGKNKLAVVQTLGGTPDNVEIITTLIHESGEWIRGSLMLKPVKADPQGVGSAITYGRRYGITAILGIIQEDDDGNAASRPPKDAPNPSKASKHGGKTQHYKPETRDNPHEMPEKVAETPDLKVIPNNPMPYTQKKDNAPIATETPSNELQLPPSIIEKIKDKTAREAFDIIDKYAFGDGQGGYLKAIVKTFYPEYFDNGLAKFQIPESALVAILLTATGIRFEKAEKTPKCKAKGCKNVLTALEAEKREGLCREHFTGSTEDD